jgi:hypothetical protein
MNPTRDFLVMAMDAPEEADLTDPCVWRRSNLVAHPGYEHATEIHKAFGIDFGARNGNGELINSFMDLRWNGWLEGSPVRLEHPGGSGAIVNILRTAQNMHGNVSIRTIFDDRGESLSGRFDRIFSDPGLGITHSCNYYDRIDRMSQDRPKGHDHRSR